MSSYNSVVATAVTTAVPAGIAVATFSLFGIQIGILSLVSVTVALLMSISTRVYVNMKSKKPINWRENLMLGTITTTLSIGVVSEYQLSFLFAAGAGVAISAAGEAIIATLGQGASDVTKDAVQAIKERVKGALGSKSAPEDDQSQKSPEDT